MNFNQCPALAENGNDECSKLRCIEREQKSFAKAVRFNEKESRLLKVSSINRGRVGSFFFLPFFVVFGILGFASPVYFGTVSEDTFGMLGKRAKPSMRKRSVSFARTTWARPRCCCR